MKKILDIIDNYIIILDKIGRITFCNQKILKKLNYKMEELEFENINTLIEGINIFENNDKDLILKYKLKNKESIYLHTKIVKEDESIAIVSKDIVKNTYTVKELEQMLDNLPFNCWLKNIEGQYLYVNESYAKELNDTKNNIRGKTSSDYWSTEQAKQFSEMDKEVIKSKKYQVTERYSIKDNFEIWTETYKAPILNNDNQVEYLIGYTKDITLQKNIDNEVQNNNQINYINNILAKSDKEKSMEEFLTNIGDSIIKYLECDSLSILLMDKLSHSVDLKIVCGEKDKYEFDYNLLKDENNLKKIINSRCINSIKNINEFSHKMIVSFMRKNKIDNIGIYSILVDDNTVGFLVLKFYENNNLKFNKIDYIKNICNNMAYLIKTHLLSKELKNEFAIRKRIEEELELYLEISVDLVARLDLNGNIKYLNNNCTSTLGWSIDELKSMNILDIISEESIDLYKEIIKGEIDNLGHVVTKLICKDGNYRWVEVNYRANRYEDSIIVTAKDITEHKKREEENKLLEETIQLESLKSEFFANISHEFRTPLNIILGTMQLIQRYIDKGKISWDDNLNFESHIHYIRQNSYRLLRLVNNLIDMTCIDSGYFKVELGNYNIVNIIESITLSVVSHIEEKGISLVFDTNTEEVIVACDPDKIERIMLNLLSNAIKYTEKEGSIEVNINATDSVVRVSVKDNGMGISKDKLNVIFDRFKRIDSELNRKCEGSGIGLSLVKSLVELQNGSIHANSEFGIGSEFVFEIPIVLVSNLLENTSENEIINSAQIEKCNIEFSDIYS